MTIGAEVMPEGGVPEGAGHQDARLNDRWARGGRFEQGTPSSGTGLAGQTEVATAPESLVTLSMMKGAVRRQRRWVVLAAAFGLLAGAAAPFVIPAKHTATSDLYLTEPAIVGASAGMSNDLSLLETRAVAQKAVSALHLHESSSAFLDSYQGTAVSDVILSVKLSAPTRAKAVAYDNALAQAFLAFRASELTYQTNILVHGLDSQVKSLDRDIQRLTVSINAVSSGPPSNAANNQLTQLINQRSNDESQVTSLQAQADQDVLSDQSVIKGSSLLDPAVAAASSGKKVIVEDSMSGLVAAAGIALGLVVLFAVISDRPKRRADLAVLLGVPVGLSIGRFPRCRWLCSWRLRRRALRPSRDVRLVEQRLRRQLEHRGVSGLAVVELGAAQVAAVGVAAAALSLAAEGRSVLVVDMADGRPLASLLRLPRKHRSSVKPHGVSVKGRALSVVCPPEGPDTFTVQPGGHEADHVLVLASVSPATGADHLAPWANSAVVMVTAGRASATAISSCAHLLRDAAVPLVSGIMVNVGREDETFGAPAHEPVAPVPQL